MKPTAESQGHEMEVRLQRPNHLPLATLTLSLPLSPHLLSKPTNPPLPSTLSPFPPTTIKSQLSSISAPSPSPSTAKPKSNSLSSSSSFLPSLTHSPSPFNPFPSPPFPFGRRCTLLWFRSDLRVTDHEPLSAANEESLSVLPVFIFDPRDFGKSPAGFDRTGPYRAQFLIDSVSDLRSQLRARGSDLVVRIGRPETVLPELARSAGASAVFAHREVSRDEVRCEERVEKALGEESVEMKFFWGSTLYHVDDLPFVLDDMPSNYGGFREKVKGIAVRKVIDAPDQVKGLPSRGGIEVGDIPTLGDLGLTPPPAAISQDGLPASNSSLIGGETEALGRLKNFAAECSAQPNVEKDNMHESIYGANFSCKISPWLATGCLSPRFMYEELKNTATKAFSVSSAAKKSSDKGMNWLMFELLWRDFFRFITKKYSAPKKGAEVVPVTACTGAFA